MSRYVAPRCPLRPDDKCSLCQPGATGPHDCGLVYLMRTDEDLQALYRERQQQAGRRAPSSPGVSVKQGDKPALAR